MFVLALALLVLQLLVEYLSLLLLELTSCYLYAYKSNMVSEVK